MSKRIRGARVSDPDFLLSFTESAADRFKAGELSLDSLTSRLEGVADEVQCGGTWRSEELIDAWDELETCNAVILDRVDRWGWGGVLSNRSGKVHFIPGRPQ